MASKKFGEQTIDVDDNGYLTSLDQWSRDLAGELARETGINKLSDKHWEVIDYIQGEYKKGSALTIRKIGKSGVVSIKDFYELFPEGPLKKASLIAGIPKPVGCI